MTSSPIWSKGLPHCQTALDVGHPCACGHCLHLLCFGQGCEEVQLRIYLCLVADPCLHHPVPLAQPGQAPFVTFFT